MDTAPPKHITVLETTKEPKSHLSLLVGNAWLSFGSYIYQDDIYTVYGEAICIPWMHTQKNRHCFLLLSMQACQTSNKLYS